MKNYTVSADNRVVYIYQDHYKVTKCVGLRFNLAILYTQKNGDKFRFAGITTKGYVRNFLCSEWGL